MDVLKVILKVLFILAMVLLMALPFIMEYLTFRSDKKNKITYKRFRIVVYTAIYMLAVTVAMVLLTELFQWLGTIPVIQWLVGKLALTGRQNYCTAVFVAIAINFVIGLLYVLLSKLVRIGLKKKDLTKPKKKNGQFSWGQKNERRIIRFFHTETWFFVGNIVKWLTIALSVIYALFFILYQIPAVFRADWLDYDIVTMLFSAGYLYPTITLLGLWSMYFFLEGIKLLTKECPELLRSDAAPAK